MSIASHESWTLHRADAEVICARVASLIRDNGVMVRYLGKPLLGMSSAQLITLVSRTVGGEETGVPIPRLAEVVEGVWNLRDQGLQPCRLDVGLLSASLPTGAGLEDALKGLEGLVSPDATPTVRPSRDVVLYGFGRIGRLLTRLLMERHGPGTPLALRAIVLRPAKNDQDLYKRAALLEHDSVHGAFDGQVEVDSVRNQLIINGLPVQVIYASQPEDIDYSQYDLTDPLIIDNTGVFKTEEALGRHLGQTKARQVLLTAPASGAVPNVVYGLNDAEVTTDSAILSAASCTTNAAAPVLSVLHQRFGIVSGHLETIHAFTNDQNLIDNFHKADRRGRAAPLNLVITSTGAAKAVTKVVPALSGKLTGNAIRVPTPNVSLVILSLEFDCEVDTQTVNAALLEESRSGSLAKQIGYSIDSEAVSSDFVGERTTGIVDAKATIVKDNKAVLYVWYDNEVGYSAQVLRVAAKMSAAEIPTISN